MGDINSANDSIDLKDAKELLELLGKLDVWQKQIVLATIRGATLITECEKKGA